MKSNTSKTTLVNRPKSSRKRYAPQIPDTNRPDLGRPLPKPTKAKGRKKTK